MKANHDNRLGVLQPRTISCMRQIKINKKNQKHQTGPNKEQSQPKQLSSHQNHQQNRIRNKNYNKTSHTKSKISEKQRSNHSKRIY